MSGQGRIELVFSRPRFAVMVGTACITGLGLLAAGWFAGVAAGARPGFEVAQATTPRSTVSAPAAVSAPATEAEQLPPVTPPAASVEPPANPRYVVQTGSFRDRAEAARLARKLTQSGYAAGADAWKDSEDREWWIVRVGPYEGRAAAEQAASELGPLTRSTALVRLLDH